MYRKLYRYLEFVALTVLRMTEGFYDLAFMSGIQSRGRGAVSGGNVNAYLYVCSKSVSRPRYVLSRSVNIWLTELPLRTNDGVSRFHVFTNNSFIYLFFFLKPLNKSKSSLYWFFYYYFNTFRTASNCWKCILRYNSNRFSIYI